jgi:hypothetical protein
MILTKLSKTNELNEFLDIVRRRNPHEPEFLQAVKEVAEVGASFFE